VGQRFESQTEGRKTAFPCVLLHFLPLLLGDVRMCCLQRPRTLVNLSQCGEWFTKLLSLFRKQVWFSSKMFIRCIAHFSNHNQL